MASPMRPSGWPTCVESLRQLRKTKLETKADMKLPRDVGPIHFIGIGGIGMSGIAEVMATLGYQACRAQTSATITMWRGCARTAFRSSSAMRRPISATAQVVVVSSAVKDDNPELDRGAGALPAHRAARGDARGTDAVQILRRGRAARMARRRRHRIVAALLDAGGFDPTVINGGIINAYGTNARLGKGDWMVVESDESDGTFVKLPADIVIVTNIDPEHLDHYGSFDKAQARRISPSSRIFRFTALRSCASIIRGAGTDRPGA